MPAAPWGCVIQMRISDDLQFDAEQDLQELRRGLRSPDGQPGAGEPQVNVYREYVGDADDAARFELWTDPRDRSTQPDSNEDLDLGQLLGKLVETRRGLLSTKGEEAQQVAVILWGHGSGWLSRAGGSRRGAFSRLPPASGGTSRHGPLSVRVIQRTLGTFRQQQSSRIAFLGYDSCGMGCIEVVYQLRADVDWMVCTEVPEPASGWDYRAIGAELRRSPPVTPARLAEVVMSSYIDTLANSGGIEFQGFTGADPFLIAAVQPASLDEPDLKKSITDFATKLTKRLKRGDPQVREEILTAASQAAVAGPSTAVDLVRFVAAIGDRDLAAKLKSRIEGVARDAPGAGLSVYLPDPEGTPLAEYQKLDFAQDCGWGEFIMTYQNAALASTSAA